MDTREKLDCGHRAAADRPTLDFCEDCIARICCERDQAQRKVRELESAVSQLAGEVRTLEAALAAARAEKA
jgi:hypothetical protein